MSIAFFILLLPLASFNQEITDDIDSLTVEKDSVIIFYNPEPKFPGGMDSLKNFITQNLSVKEFSHFHSEESKKVFIEFLVEKDGSLSNFSIKKSSGIPEFDKKALEMLKKMPKWIPAESPKGDFYQMYLTIPITLVAP